MSSFLCHLPIFLFKVLFFLFVSALYVWSHLDHYHVCVKFSHRWRIRIFSQLLHQPNHKKGKVEAALLLGMKSWIFNHNLSPPSQQRPMTAVSAGNNAQETHQLVLHTGLPSVLWLVGRWAQSELSTDQIVLHLAPLPIVFPVHVDLIECYLLWTSCYG